MQCPAVVAEALRRARAVAACTAAAALVAGCSLWRPTVVPLRTIVQPAPCAARPDTLLVLLPGSHSLPEDFLREGFVQAIRERRIAADVLLVDAHVGYYDQRSIVTRLQADIVQPARAQGYRHIWLTGISIGAVGSMLYAQAQPDDVDGLLLIAPFLGSRLSAKEIEVAGGLAAWQAPNLPGGIDFDLALWRWLQMQTSPATAGRKLPLFLGYGNDDRFVYNDKVLSQALPPARVFTAEGGHDWPAWKALWPRMLDATPLPRDGSCVPAP
jgi:pimeloyl-ACP methyl ester carboxylesterase